MKRGKSKPYIGLQCQCGAGTIVANTYHYANGQMIHRRRRCTNGHKFSTVEKLRTETLKEAMEAA